YLLIPPYYAASGGEYTQKRFKYRYIMKKKDKNGEVQALINKATSLKLNAKELDDYVEKNCLTALYEGVDKTPIIEFLIEEANSYNERNPTDTMYRLYTLMKISFDDTQYCKNAISYILNNLQEIKHRSTDDCHSIVNFLTCLYSTEENIFIDNLKNKTFIGSDFIGSEDTMQKITDFYSSLPNNRQENILDHMLWWYGQIFEPPYTEEYLSNILDNIEPNWHNLYSSYC
ncbi:MAG: hypothetical protein LN588_05750, partial [Rickettsia endosymbiont of Bryobia graminum]|nr:hypothetical protein [Rickettsia endosymbiont of Bryobia graminum]